MVSLELAETGRQLVGTHCLGPQTLLDHRLEPAERSVHAIFGSGRPGHCSPAGGLLSAARLRLLHARIISATPVSGQHVAGSARVSPQYLAFAAGFAH